MYTLIIVRLMERKPGIQEFPIEMYIELLEYIKTKYADKYWHALPKEVSSFWKSEMVDSQ